jgi:hypothetical protein
MESSQEAYDAALENYRHAEQLAAEFAAAETAHDALTRAERGQSLVNTVPPGWCEHWKSCNEPGMTAEDDHWKFYAVKGLDHKKGVFKVDYTALYAPHAGTLFDRPLIDPEEGFLLPINRPQWQPRPYVGPRFRLIRPLSPQECDVLIREARHIALCRTRAEAYERITRALARA